MQTQVQRLVDRAEGVKRRKGGYQYSRVGFVYILWNKTMVRYIGKSTTVPGVSLVNFSSSGVMNRLCDTKSLDLDFSLQNGEGWREEKAKNCIR